MKLFLDQNIPRSAVKELLSLGFEVEHASEVGLTEAVDKTIATFAKKQNAILVTKDLDFGSVLTYPKGSHYGLLILRLPHYLSAEDSTRMLKNFLENTDHNNLVGKITILELGRYRTREIQ